MSKYINFTKEQREQAMRTDLASFLTLYKIARKRGEGKNKTPAKAGARNKGTVVKFKK